jgi:CheY-like chemotaxis protein
MPSAIYAVSSGSEPPGPELEDEDSPLVLVVDDDEATRRDVSEILEEEGYRVIQVANGKEALERLIDRNEIRPDVVLLDLSMPVMTGWELLAILNSYVRLSCFPVVLISGVDPQLDPIMHGTIAAFLRKPYDMKTLIETVKRVIDAAATAASK